MFSLLDILILPLLVWCSLLNIPCLSLLLILFLLDVVALPIFAWCFCSSCFLSMLLLFLLLLLSLFNSFAPFVLVWCGTHALLARHYFSFLLAQCSPFFFSLFNTIALLFLVQLYYSSILARRYYFSFLGRCCDSCVLYLTLLLLCSLLVPNVVCSHLGISLLCHDVVAPMFLVFCVCSSCSKLVLFPLFNVRV